MTVSVVALAGPAAAGDTARADLLAAEAARFASTAGPGGISGWLWLGTVLLGTMLAAFAGTYYGSRRKVRIDAENEHHREVTFRLTKNEPLHLKSETLGRLAGVLDDLEDIGTKLKSAPHAAAPADDVPRETREVARTIRESVPEEAPRTVEFARRVENPAPAARPVRPAVEAPVPEAPAPEPPAAATAPLPARSDRKTRYERARHLLQEGRPAGEIRELTGLKSAELDLLRAVPAAAAAETPPDPIRRERIRFNFHAGDPR